MGFIETLKQFFGNYMLISAIVAWLIAQILKIFTGVYRDRHVNISVLLFSTGGMPSSHSASVLGLTTAAAFKHGVGSTAFAICCILSVIVIIDAMGVRYETGKQAKMLNKIVKEMFTDTEHSETHFKEFIGHTPLQVFVGAILGFIVATVMFFAFYR
ncbi:MAG: divergent PAP2 family protein [Ruminococcaceae bacterium]|nr:divergent PAP2 family protein [Oscillospiraceae bacterium]